MDEVTVKIKIGGLLLPVKEVNIFFPISSTKYDRKPWIFYIETNTRRF